MEDISENVFMKDGGDESEEIRDDSEDEADVKDDSQVLRSDDEIEEEIAVGIRIAKEPVSFA